MKRGLTALAIGLALSAPAAALTKKHGAARGRVARTATAHRPLVPPVPANLAGIQYLYGSAEAAALTRQTWRVLADYVDSQLASGSRKGVVLTPDSTLANPHFLPCGDKPPAIVLDMDETAILNLGAEYDDLVAQRKTFDPAAWDRWEKTGANYVVATPGAKEALDRLRYHGVTVVFNSNRAAANAAGAEGAVNVAGLGPARHGETLFLNGDDALGSAKDGRRATIATHYCVLAMAGDQLVDFSDLFTTEPNGFVARRAAVAFSGIAALWGAGWFVLPNPVYGKALQGGPDDIFPTDKQWRDPGPAAPRAAIPASTPMKAKQ